MRNRRPSAARLLLVLLVACALPVVVGMAAGVTGLPVIADEVETAGGDGGRGRADLTDTAAADAGDRRSASTSVVPTTAPATTAAPPPTTAAPAPSPEPPSPPSTATPTTAAPPAPAPAPGDQVVALVNAARADAGCGPLQVDERLALAAQRHSDDMAANDYFSHVSLDGRTFVDRVRAAGYPQPGGENIAQGQRGPAEVHDAWMNSEGHRANILNCSFTAIGVGLHAGSWTWTQNFGY